MLLSAAAGWENSATNDEPELLFAAASAVQGRGLWTPEHLPLYRFVAGLPLLLLPLAEPEADFSRIVANYPGAIHAFLHENSKDPLWILRTARLGMLVFLPILAWGTYRLGEKAGGKEVGLLAALAVLSQPLVLGHAFLVHTDVATAACWVWALVFFERFLAGEKKAWLGLGIWLGLALSAKQSSIFLLLFLLFRLLVGTLRGLRVQKGQAVASLFLALAITYGLTAFTIRKVGLEEEKLFIQLVTARFHGWSWVGDALLSLAELSVPGAHRLLGLAFVAWNSAHGQGVNFFLGQLSPQGFFLYFPFALVAKLTAPFTVLWLAGAVRWRRLPSLARWCLIYAGLFLFASSGSSYNIGARHVLPMVPLLAVVAGCTWAGLAGRLQAAALATLVAAPILAFPSYIAHFSLLSGGPWFREKLLSDSNLDWGQDWARLAKLAKAKGWLPLFALYLGPDDPSGYGMQMENLLASGRIPQRGFVAVSSYAAVVGPAYLDYKGLRQTASFVRKLLRHLQHCQHLATVGGTIKVFSCGIPTESGQKEREEPPPTPAVWLHSQPSTALPGVCLAEPKPTGCHESCEPQPVGCPLLRTKTGKPRCESAVSPRARPLPLLFPMASMSLPCICPGRGGYFGRTRECFL